MIFSVIRRERGRSKITIVLIENDEFANYGQPLTETMYTGITPNVILCIHL